MHSFSVCKSSTKLQMNCRTGKSPPKVVRELNALLAVTMLCNSLGLNYTASLLTA
jgi:hypothetical protein